MLNNKFLLFRSFKMSLEDILIFSVSVFCVFLLIGAIIIALVVPDGNSPSSSLSNRHRVFRLPQGSQKTSSHYWVWQNETVRGLFRVYTGEGQIGVGGNDFNRLPGKQAGKCCSQLDGYLQDSESYEIEADNDGSFSSATMISVFSDAAAIWENIIGNKFGAQTVTSDSAGLVFNNRNQIGLGSLDIDVPGALAVTGLWMVCPSGGSISACDTSLKISEWDQTYDITNNDWCVNGDSGCFDLRAVAVHEFGHNVGLDDLTATECYDSTMYGYSARGETQRRSLDSDTIRCVQDLYGITTSSSGASSRNISIEGLALVLLMILMIF